MKRLPVLALLLLAGACSSRRDVAREPDAPDEGWQCGGTGPHHRRTPHLVPGSPQEIDPARDTPPLLLDTALSLDGAPFQHSLPTEQVVGTPVPFYLEPPATFVFASAELRYKPFGAIRWKRMPPEKLGDGLAWTVPCEDVTTTGDLKYYFRFLDAGAELLDSLGSPKEPLRVVIKNDLRGGAPRLPGRKPPGQCFDDEAPN